jgi:plastocyanin
MARKLAVSFARRRRAPRPRRRVALGAANGQPHHDRVRFIPDLIFEHDVHFRLHLENHGKETHELTAPTFFATSDIRQSRGSQSRAHRNCDACWRDQDIFLTAHRPGTYDLLCADHDWADMVGGITVE